MQHSPEANQEFSGDSRPLIKEEKSNIKFSVQIQKLRFTKDALFFARRRRHYRDQKYEFSHKPVFFSESMHRRLLSCLNNKIEVVHWSTSQNLNLNCTVLSFETSAHRMETKISIGYYFAKLISRVSNYTCIQGREAAV